MRRLAEHLQERNHVIGALLRENRERSGVSISECAERLNTSRRRYLSMEAGEAMIGVAELEILIELLGIPADTVWPNYAEAKSFLESTASARHNRSLEDETLKDQEIKRLQRKIGELVMHIDVLEKATKGKSRARQLRDE